MEEQLRAIMQQLANLGAPRAPSNPSENDDLEGSDINPFHPRDQQDDRHGQRTTEDSRDNLNIKIEIPEYHSSLRNDDFVEWLEAVKWVFDYKETEWHIAALETVHLLQSRTHGATFIICEK